jgi:hypothetical protein
MLENLEIFINFGKMVFILVSQIEKKVNILKNRINGMFVHIRQNQLNCILEDCLIDGLNNLITFKYEKNNLLLS